MTNFSESGQIPPKPTIWTCPNCDCHIQIVVDPAKEWLHAFVCVCGHTMAAGEVHESSVVTGRTCAHCHVVIVDESSVVEQNGLRYCCGNCARAHADLLAGL